MFEFRRLIPTLTDPGRYGGDPADAFAALMTDVLGYPRFAAQGGDRGSFISSRPDYRHPEQVIGIHLNLLAVRAGTRDPRVLPALARQALALCALLREWTDRLKMPRRI